MTETQLTAIVVSTVVLTVPLLLPALGGLVSERSGVFAIGLEGYMLVGAFSAVVAASLVGPWLGAGAAALAGLVLAGLYGVLVIRYQVNQIILSVAVIVLAIGATNYFNGVLLAESDTFVQRAPGLPRIPLPGLSGIPVVGPSLFDQNILVYLAIIASVVLVYLMNATHAGLRLRGVGEDPLAAETRGIPVARVRYGAVLFSGAMAGLGGAMLSLGQLNAFTNEMTAGRGFIALAAIIFSGWRPLGIVVACVLFGAADAGQIWVNAIGLPVPPQFLAMLPYVLTLVVLAVGAGRRPHPAALGRPFDREQR